MNAVDFAVKWKDIPEKYKIVTVKGVNIRCNNWFVNFDDFNNFNAINLYTRKNIFITEINTTDVTDVRGGKNGKNRY